MAQTMAAGATFSMFVLVVYTTSFLNLMTILHEEYVFQGPVGVEDSRVLEPVRL